MASMTIRELDPATDAGGYVDLLLVTHPWAVANTTAWQHGRSAIPERARLFSRVAEDGGTIVGAVEARLDFFGSGDTASLRVWVRPSHQNRGIGSALYDLGFEHLQSLGARRAASTFEESEAGVEF